MGNRFQDPSSSEYSTPSVSASDGDPAPESAPRPNIAQRFARHASDWLRKMAITGAMRNTTADTSCEAYRSYLSEHPTGDHTTSTVEERFRSSSTPLVPPARRAISEGRTRISNSLAVSPHGHAYRDMDYSQDECEVRERGRAYPEYTEPDASASEAHEPYRQQSLYQFDLARSSSPSDNQYFTPMKQYDPFDRSSPNRGNWLLQRPCRHDDFEDMMDIDHVSRTSRRPSDNGRPDLTIPSELNEEQDRVVCAISESRSSDMIGVAAINITLGQVDLVKVVNDDRYRRLTETVWRMPIQPQTFLLLKKVVNQPTKSALAVGLEQNFPNAEIVPLDREHWNESEGWRMVDRFAWRQDIKVIRENLEHNFYVSCAFSALMAYIEEETEVIFRENSLRIKYKQAADTMGLDRSTITSLELFQNIRNTKGTSSTLFGLLNNTLTPQGRRMIRSALLQPSTNSQEITARHEAVEEFSSNEDLFTEVRANLKQLLHIDVERSIPWVSLNTEEYRLPLHDGVALIQGRHQLAMPSHGELQGAEKDLSHILMLKAYLRGVQAIQETLEAGSCTSELCKWVLEKCGRENTAPMVGVIDEGIESDAIYSKAPIDIRNNRLWAIKAEPNGVLEGARQLYRNRTNELHQYVQELTKAFQEHLGTVPELRLANDNHYWLRFQWSDVERELAKDQVPTEDGRSGGARTLRPQLLGGVQIVNGIRRKHHYDCQTLELIQRSSQIQRHADIVTAQSDTFVADLKKSLLEHAEPLLAVNEAIAVLDMVCSFAHLATTQNYVRPIISDNLVFKGARHPIVEARKPNFVPNDVYSGDNGGRFQVVTGGNMSGKSTFIRTIALIQIMAQVGSFVPASYAAIPICDRLFTRLSTEDKPESNLGTFAVEMSEMNMILRQVTKDSMVIVDELGRGTSPKEGLAIALSMTDELIKTGCRVFFATHFTELARVLNFTKRDSVLNIHLSSDSTKDGDVAQISLPHTIAPGPVKNEDYGLDLSRRFLPERVVNNAERVSVSSTMDDSALGSYVKKLQTEFTIRMNIAADDDTQLVEDQTDNNAKRPANLPLLEKPSEEELKEWKKKCDEGERRVMHVNMAYTQDKKHSVVDEEDRTYPYKKSKAGDDTASLASQPTPINRGFLIEELRRDACTPIARANPAISGTDTDSIMEDAPRPARMSLPPRPVPSKRSLHRAISITSSSSVYDEDMADIDEADDALTATSERPGPEAYSELVQPLEQFQPLEKFQPLKEWYARQGQTEGSEPREAPTPSSLTGSRFDTQDSLQSVEEDEEVYDD
ncbi:hypothetical protein N657DRAFT_686488 [Parathielavia appendiculata]|uniref:DNA mismatch repair protein MSH3 n=1 Tax=Parathielavia appendiculata TaxID=2587402 RepID=A0AAN6U9T1_9PEZI|nr:hypothetical protein N657DRAFT_686488 [Parathielavia appendiculata]